MRTTPVLLCVLALLGGSPGPANGASFNVNIGDDVADSDLGDGVCDVSDIAGEQCTLRAAIQTADQTGEMDQIFVPAALFALTLGGAGEDAGATGDLDVSTPIEIRGPRNGRDFTFIDGKKAKDRIFDVHPGGSLTLHEITLLNGKNAKDDFDPGSPGEVSGGCLRSAGDVTLDAVFFFRCASRGDGGCMSVIDGTAEITDTTFISCKAKAEGGGLEVTAAGEATLERSTLAFCKGGLGGGIAARGDLTLLNATVDVNKAKLGGGVTLLGDANATLNNTTISSNKAVNLDASQTTGTVTVSNSILWGAKNGDCLGSVVSEGGNLEGATSCGFTAMNDQQNQDPELLPLNFYGGDVPTRAVIEGSPALDHGVDLSCETEDARLQLRRDVPNVGVAECDSGSFEFQP